MVAMIFSLRSERRQKVEKSRVAASGASWRKG